MAAASSSPNPQEVGDADTLCGLTGINLEPSRGIWKYEGCRRGSRAF